MESTDMQIDVEAPAVASSTTLPGTRCKQGSCAGSGGVQIYYEVYGHEALSDCGGDSSGPRVIMIMGLACGANGWRWQLQDLLQHQPPTSHCSSTPGTCCPSSNSPHQQSGPQPPPPPSPPAAAAAWCSSPTAPAAAASAHLHLHQQQHHKQQQQRVLAPPLTVCVLDNRGIGRSEAPRNKKQYSTTIMGQDVLRVMDHLGWSTAHIVGYSMGGMIATKLAAAAPERVCSLTLISTSGGGWQTIPHSWKGLRTGLRLLMARSPEETADATLSMHFTGHTLRQWVDSYRAQRRDLLRREYLSGHNPPQEPEGFQGQVAACWAHRLDGADVDAILAGGFPVLVIHGRRDALASVTRAEALAARLRAPFVVLEGAHFIVRECAGQINALLAGLVLGHTHFQAIPCSPYLEPWDPSWRSRPQQQAQQAQQQQPLQQQQQQVPAGRDPDSSAAAAGALKSC